MDDLVTRLREAAARVSRHCFKQPGDSGLMSIPADPTRDVDLLLEAAATRLAKAEAKLAAWESAKPRCACGKVVVPILPHHSTPDSATHREGEA